MIDISPIKQLFSDSFYTILETPSSKRRGTLTLREPESNGIKEINVIDLPINSVLIKIDNAPVPIFFNDSAGKQRRCDYLLLTNNGSINFKIFIEMKGED